MSATEQDPPPNPDLLWYRDTVLGQWSSHPHWLEHGSRTTRKVVVGVLVASYLLAFYLWLRGHNLSSVIPAVWTWTRSLGGEAVVALVAFIFGMSIAASLQLRAALWHAEKNVKARANGDESSFNIHTAGAVFLLGFVLPEVLTFAPSIAPELRLLGVLLALLPAAVLSYLLPSRRDRDVSFPWFSLLVLFPLLLGLTVVGRAAAWLYDRIPQSILDSLPRIGTAEGWRNALIILTFSVATFALIRLSLWRRTLTQAKAHAAPVELATPAANPPEPSDWVAVLAKELGAGNGSVSELKPDVAETVGWARNSEFESFFDGHCPTQDQHKVLADFVALLSEISLAQRDEGGPRTGFDLILEGPPGTGRTETLDAIALVAAIAQGDHVLMFVADATRVSLAVSRIAGKLERLNFGAFLCAGTLSDARGAYDAGRTPPEICVTTPEEWEATLPGVPLRDGAAFERARGLMCLYTKVLVDDWMEHPVGVRMHLPFIVDKHRLLLDSRMLPSARVFVFPRLNATGQALVLDRLIGHSGIIDASKQLARLRYRADLAARVLEISAESVEAKVLEVAEALCRAGQGSVLMRRGVDGVEALRQTEDLRSRFQNARITVCYCDDQLDALVGDIAAIIMKVADGPDAVFALQSHDAEDSLVMIRVRGTRELPMPRSVTPLLVDRSGRGMAEAHLYNILRFIEDRTPVAQRSWGQLGVVGIPGERPGQAQIAGRLLLDRPEDVCEEERRNRPYLRTLGSFMALDAPFKRLDSIYCDLIPDPGIAWWMTGGDAKFGPAILNLPDRVDGSGSSSSTTMLWKGNDGVELGRSQLHYTAQLVLRRNQAFCPESLRVDAVRGVEVRARSYRDDGMDAIHPKFEVRWQQLDETCPAEPPEPASGGPSHGYLWIDQRTPMGTRVTSTLIERTDDQDRPTPCAGIAFQYQALIRPLLIAPTEAVVETTAEFREALRTSFATQRDWGVDDATFLPGFTYALTRGLEASVPGSAVFAKLLAFRTDGAMAAYAKAIVWFVEPVGTGTTLSNAFHELLCGDGFLSELVERMQRVLAQGWDKSPKPDLARFWLPSSRRKPILQFERTLVEHLRAREPNVTPPVLPIAKLQATCPDCEQSIEFEANPVHGGVTLEHCGRTIVVLKPTAGGLMVTPKSLLGQWWPPSVPLPRGSDTERVHAVWELVAARMEYRLDASQAEHMEECWLPPAESWSRGTGDCEDHAIVIVTMLRTLGIRSWLTWGTAWDNGHAWVEAVLDGRHTVIEATAKAPLATTLPTRDETTNVWGTAYTPATGPARTDGETYDQWDGAQWTAVAIAEPAPVSNTRSIPVVPETTSSSPETFSN